MSKTIRYSSNLGKLIVIITIYDFNDKFHVPIIKVAKYVIMVVKSKRDKNKRGKNHVNGQ